MTDLQPNPAMAGTTQLPVPESVTSRRRGQLARFLLRYGIVLALIALAVFFAWRSPVFLTSANLLQVLLQASVNTIVALGMTFVIITAGIDLSVGSTAALAGMVTAMTMKTGLPILGIAVPWQVAVVVGILVGVLVGLTNGLLITSLRITPFIVTLGMLSVVRGLTLIYSEGRPIFGFPEGFNNLAGTIGSIPTPAIIAGVLAVVSALVLRFTRFGEYTYAIGGNEEAARFSGVPVNRYKVAVYTLCGALAATAGVVLTARLRTAEPNAATGYELDAIAATVMGGTSLFGGEGTVVGTVIGALIIATLRNGLNLMNVQAFYQQLAIGLVIILAVALDRFRQ
jgi:ribose/xylose/arabinose/galactoside ABC-type transport system permease subunit